MPEKHVVCAARDLPPGARKIIQIGKKSVGVFNVHGEYFALLNLCPHQFAPLCEGRVGGYCPPSPVGELRLEREGEIIRCPWHAWEFDIKTGRSIFNPHRVRTASYPAHVETVAAVENEPGVETFPTALEEGQVVVIV